MGLPLSSVAKQILPQKGGGVGGGGRRKKGEKEGENLGS